LRAALRHGRAVGYWIGRAEKKGVALGLAEEALLSSQGDVARQSLGVEAAEAGADRLRALVERLDRAWRKEHGTVRALAADALWALRWHLPRGLRLRLALARSPRLLRRAALPLAGALVAALAFILVLWGPRLWMPRPEIEWVDVPAGEFVMGSSDADPDADSSEKPQHTVYLDAYRIGKYEVTNRQYAQCVRAKVCKEPTDTEYYDDPAYADHPVVSLRWLDTRDFCRWIGGRLPTEAEWEKAARGTDGRIYPWGDEPPDCDKANLPGCTGGTKAVGSYPEGASPYGAMSMAGNVYEWVADRHAADYYARSPERNPQGPDAGDLRVLRGGSWDRPHSDARCTARLKSYPGVSYPNDGVRCVYPISRPGS
jgi:formylglycine-generating enzyme required for sulfatase activity